MRDRAAHLLVLLCAVVFVRNFYLIFLVMPDESAQGMIYRLLYFHVPSWWTAFLAVILATVSSAFYLHRRSLRHDALAAAATEVALVFLIVGITLGSIWGRIIWGIWRTWDARLTSALLSILLYGSYLILRRSIDEPSQRARISAVFSLFAFLDIPIVWFSIRWWRTQHPQPMELSPEMWRTMFWNWLGMILLAAVLVSIRFDQEQVERSVCNLRQELCGDPASS